MSGWRYSFRDRIRYGDLDTNAHLNNVAVHQFFESARVAYMRELFPEIDPMGAGRLRDDLRRDARALRLARLLRGGPARRRAPEELQRSSVKLAFQMVSEADERLVAEGWGTLVGYDYAEGRAAPFPERSRSGCAPRAPGNPGHELRTDFDETPAESVERVRREQLEAAADGLREDATTPRRSTTPASASRRPARCCGSRARAEEQGVPAPQPRAARRGPRHVGARDADVLVETVDDLAERFPGRAAYGPVYVTLAAAPPSRRAPRTRSTRSSGPAGTSTA